MTVSAELDVHIARYKNYVRNGTLDLFAALNIATGEVLARCKPQHRAQDFVAFLREIEASVEPALEVHVVLDDLSAHRAPVVHCCAHNDKGKPFTWTQTADEILDKMRRFGLRTQQVHAQ